jgi:CspA family cold shock protein
VKTANRLQKALGQRVPIEAPTRSQLSSIIPAGDRTTDADEHEVLLARDRAKHRTPAPKAGRARDTATSGSAERGTIKWFDARRGFGFIERPGEDDLFVHENAIQKSKNRRIAEGQPVRYLVGPGRRGPEARNVELVSA